VLHIQTRKLNWWHTLSFILVYHSLYVWLGHVSFTGTEDYICQKMYPYIIYVMVSVFASCTVDHRFEPFSSQTNTNMWCFFANHAAFISNGKYWLARNKDNVSKWSPLYNPLYCTSLSELSFFSQIKCHQNIYRMWSSGLGRWT
jgi:hypothetical protein